MSGVYFAVAAACMARGLTAAEADEVLVRLSAQPAALSGHEAFDQLQAAIEGVRQDRIERSRT